MKNRVLVPLCCLWIIIFAPTHAVGFQGQPIPGREAPRLDVDDPQHDGWDSEVISQAAAGQLDRIARIISRPKTLSVDDISPLISAAFSSDPLRPDPLREVFRDKSLVVNRWEGRSREELDPLQVHGAEGFLHALRQLSQPLAGAEEVRVHFKIFTITGAGTQLTTQAYYEASGRTQHGSLQQNALWTIQWLQQTPAASPRLQQIEIVEYQEAAVRSPEKTLLSDCTEAVLGANESFHRQLMHGVPYWSSHIQGALGTDYFGHHGMAIGDVNGDGLDDLYVCQPGGLPNRLFLQENDGTARDISTRAGVDWLDRTRSALLVDLDGDGDQDLVLATEGSLILMANDGKARFSRKASFPAVRNAYSITAADYDGDGDLDLYACHYFPRSAANDRHFPAPLPYHDARNGGSNVLLKNNRRWRFSEATKEVGLDANNHRWSFAASWEDYDNDGDPDLYVANDFGLNNLYRNEGGTFMDVAEKTGLEDGAFGMSASWGDYDHDGWMDLYVGNMFSAAGNRVLFQPRFGADASEDTRIRMQRLARGNTLYRNSGDGNFVDVSDTAGVSMGRWAWGSRFADINNDGWEDLLVSNGYLTGEDTKDL